jgi:hypothetical protein
MNARNTPAHSGNDTLPADPFGFGAWHAAHARATNAEHAVFFAAIAYTRSTGPKPTHEDFRKAKSLRAEADSLFRATLDGINRKADTLRQANVPGAGRVRFDAGA